MVRKLSFPRRRHNVIRDNGRVCEIQGLYGPYTVSERILQKIWLRQDFSGASLETVSGRRLQVEHPGRWNHLGGPDFKAARFSLDGFPVCSDVELHFYSEDWFAHRHDSNPAFNGVRLHVVLYSDPDLSIRTEDGQCPETLVLMPLLHEDLETYTINEALLSMERICLDHRLSKWTEKPQSGQMEALREKAAKRWRQKVSFAKERLMGANWSEVCHQYCLEVLGYSRNRQPMSRIARSHPLNQIASHSAEMLFYGAQLNWKFDGIRPANHPLIRLQQYLDLVTRCPDWPEALAKTLSEWPKGKASAGSRVFRKTTGLSGLSNGLLKKVLWSRIGGTRFHTLVVDAFLPLAAAAGLLEDQLCQDYWWHWPVGDCPEVIKRVLSQSGVCGAHRPFCNGLHQGILGLFISAENG